MLRKAAVQKLLAVAFWLAVWQAAAMAINRELLLVSPLSAMRTLWQLLPTAAFWSCVGFSAARILGGFFLGLISAVILAVLAQHFEWFRILIQPLMQLVKAAPVASFIILALLWVRSRNLSLLISFLMVLPVLYGALTAGMQSVDPQLLEMARVYRMPFRRQLRYLWLPGVLPSLTQGCGVALGLCWKSGVAAEVIGLPSGSIGDALYRAKITLATGEVFAWTFVIICLSALFERLILFLMNRLVRRVCDGEEKP